MNNEKYKQDLEKNLKLAKECLAVPCFKKYKKMFIKTKQDLEKYAVELIKNFEYNKKDEICNEILQLKAMYCVLEKLVEEINCDNKFSERIEYEKGKNNKHNVFK